MKVHFLGTAAFEGIPSMFCLCETCKQARQLGGPDIRTRTSVMIDDELKIDFPPDTFYHSLREGLDMDSVRDILLTHSHSDHLYPEDMVIRAEGYASYGEHTIHVYGHDLPIRHISTLLSPEKHKFKLHAVRPFEPVLTQTASVVPLLAEHNKQESCLLYYIEKGGKTVFYGHDSGWFPEATWDWLVGKKLDMAILECTTGHAERCDDHMNVEDTLRTAQWLLANKIMKPGGRIIVTHFSHNANLLHDELKEIFEPHGMTVAYDGMIVEL
ncbi:MBL fold metallo-hydrolase [Cohnella soli]|uniref:MBL fold metallo-hydrolase n=1 Tax=Cohnella soli TaxID=425005 RepID=A0ABW0HR11_9BACL